MTLHIFVDDVAIDGFVSGDIVEFDDTDIIDGTVTFFLL